MEERFKGTLASTRSRARSSNAVNGNGGSVWVNESTLARGKDAMAIESTIETREGVVTGTTEDAKRV